MNNKTLLLALLGFLIRLFLIFPGPLESKVEFFANKADLRNYYWPAQAVLKGENPYVLWAMGQSGEFRSDMAPLELVVYVATVAIWNDARAIQVLFAVFDAMNIGLLGVLLRNSPLRLPFQVFYAFGPLTLYNFVLVPADKTILLTLTFAIFYLLLKPRDDVFRFKKLRLSSRTLVIFLAAILASFKWLSVFYLLPLLLFVSRDWRDLIKYGALFGVVVGLSHLPWIPDWLYVYTFRSGRVATPFHTAPAVLLNAIGLFDKNLLLVVLALSLLLIYALFWFKRIDIFETIALSVMVGVLWTPDMDPVHLAIVVLHLLLIINWARVGRMATVWLSSGWVAFVYAVSTRSGFTRYGIPDPRLITGVYGSNQMIVLSYVLFVAVFALYVFDKRRGSAVGREILNGETI
ncbi:MAG: hypothetical protein HZB51_34535 [Chloroflexi bacterium]|nr:hypothetical protein [Chloroflexota bacterium]